MSWRKRFKALLGFDGEGIVVDDGDKKAMWIVIDFDGTIVLPVGDSGDPLDPVQLQPGVVDGLMSLKRAGHKLLLYSARANRSIRIDPWLNPLIKNGALELDLDKWQRNQPIYEARYQQMVDFVGKMLPGMFDGIDDGQQGKPNVDMFIDDRARGFRVKKPEKAWKKIMKKWGR